MDGVLSLNGVLDSPQRKLAVGALVLLLGDGCGPLGRMLSQLRKAHVSTHICAVVLAKALMRQYTHAQCSAPGGSGLSDAQYGVLDQLIKALSASPQASAVLCDIAGVLLIKYCIDRAVDLKRCIFEALSHKRLPSAQYLQKSLSGALMDVGMCVPIVSGVLKGELKKQISKMEEGFIHEMRPADRNAEFEMPRHGMNGDEIISMMQAFAKEEDVKWQEGYVSGAVYSGELPHIELLNKAYSAFSIVNPLHPDIWPSSIKFESEVVQWVANLMNGGSPQSSVCGSLTSGGTESIILAIKAHRDRARKEHNITQPNMIACVTAHAAVDKACDLMNIRLIKVPLVEHDNSYVIDVSSVLMNLTADTIMVYSSAPSFGQGVVDPIAELSEICLARGIGLHVDCCLGGFILPFARKLPEFRDNIPPFDFTLPGVTSMSVDTHKYGYAVKGTSVVLYRDRALRKYQYFAYPEWSGGMYVTPTIAGSRPGGLTAAAWASLAALGMEGFETRTRDILKCTKEIAKGVAAMPELYLMGEANAMIVCFDSKKFNIHRVGDQMTKKGWSLNSLQNPDCIHICCTVKTVGNEKKFLTDLKDSVAHVMAHLDDKDEEGSTAAIYGVAGSTPAGPVKELMYAYTDVKYMV